MGELRSAFDAADTDGDGRLSFLEWACLSFGKHLEEWEPGKRAAYSAPASTAVDAPAAERTPKRAARRRENMHAACGIKPHQGRPQLHRRPTIVGSPGLNGDSCA